MTISFFIHTCVIPFFTNQLAQFPRAVKCRLVFWEFLRWSFRESKLSLFWNGDKQVCLDHKWETDRLRRRTGKSEYNEEICARRRVFQEFQFIQTSNPGLLGSIYPMSFHPKFFGSDSEPTSLKGFVSSTSELRRHNLKLCLNLQWLPSKEKK